MTGEEKMQKVEKYVLYTYCFINEILTMSVRKFNFHYP